jgi:(p)ppGpp synthase/HD superfamily hydrolase
VPRLVLVLMPRNKVGDAFQFRSKVHFGTLFCAFVKVGNTRKQSSVLDKTVEATGQQRENILLAGLGHDLLEDTMTDRDALREILFREFGNGVVTLISEVTNTKGNEHVAAYVQHLATISDSARLIKFADLTENALNASYAVHENGSEKTRHWLEDLMLPQYNLLQSRKSSTTMPESTRLLNQFADYALKAMQHAVASGPSLTSLD